MRSFTPWANFLRTGTLVAAIVLLAISNAARLHAADAPAGEQESESGITHSFVAFGGDTYLIKDGKAKSLWAKGSRDGWMMPNGHLVIAAGKSDIYPGGAVVELDADGKTVFEVKGTQSEVHSVQPLADGNFLYTEGGAKPRLIEVNRDGKTLVDMPLNCKVPNHHMQTRMARKLANGNYLAPHLLDFAVKEYKPDGAVVNEIKTPDKPAECWPFTAIRLENGNTLITCTHGAIVIEVDPKGEIVWKLTNEDLPAPLLKDPCGAQRLPNGNTVICSYGAGGPNEVKLLEVTPEKKLVWTFKSKRGGGIHEVQILETNGKPIEGAPMK